MAKRLPGLTVCVPLEDFHLPDAIGVPVRVGIDRSEQFHASLERRRDDRQAVLVIGNEVKA